MYGQKDSISSPNKWFDKTIAQKKINVSLRGGVAFNSFTNDITTIWDGNMNQVTSPGWIVGLHFDCPILTSFNFQVGINWRNKGFKLSETTADYKHEIKAKANFIDVPILFAYKHRIKNFLEFEVAAGPYVSFGLGSGTVKDLVTYYKEPGDESLTPGWINQEHRQSKKHTEDVYAFFGDNLDESLGMRNLDVGLTFAAGISVNRFYVGFRYDLGLRDMSNKYCWSEDIKFLTRSPSIIIGLDFWK